MGSRWKILKRTGSALCFRKITLTAPCRMVWRKCEWLGGDGPGLFQQHKQETEGWDPGLWLWGGGGGGGGKFKRHCRWSIGRIWLGNDVCAGVRDKEVIRMIPRFLAWWLSGTFTGNYWGGGGTSWRCFIDTSLSSGIWSGLETPVWENWYICA